ncbi:MAG: hypothetical protein BWX70_00307 [Verrucomicrobia bacterium ADurb.Bin070]|nr:MAG: hypothetical protein BWX70_00307 [Verrucomicrobia bacterium ADurb.Bin070]
MIFPEGALPLDVLPERLGTGHGTLHHAKRIERNHGLARLDPLAGLCSQVGAARGDRHGRLAVLAGDSDQGGRCKPVTARSVLFLHRVDAHAVLVQQRVKELHKHVGVRCVLLVQVVEVVVAQRVNRLGARRDIGVTERWRDQRMLFVGIVTGQRRVILRIDLEVAEPRRHIGGGRGSAVGRGGDHLIGSGSIHALVAVLAGNHNPAEPFVRVLRPTRRILTRRVRPQDAVVARRVIIPHHRDAVRVRHVRMGVHRDDGARQGSGIDHDFFSGQRPQFNEVIDVGAPDAAQPAPVIDARIVPNARLIHQVARAQVGEIQRIADGTPDHCGSAAVDREAV